MELLQALSFLGLTVSVLAGVSCYGRSVVGALDLNRWTDMTALFFFFFRFLAHPQHVWRSVTLVRGMNLPSSIGSCTP